MSTLLKDDDDDDDGIVGGHPCKQPYAYNDGIVISTKQPTVK